MMYEATARIPEHQKNLLGTWMDSDRPDRFGSVTVRETFECESHQDARNAMCRLLVPLGVTIKSIETNNLSRLDTRYF